MPPEGKIKEPLRAYGPLLKEAALVISGGCKVAGGAQVVAELLKKKMLIEALDSSSVLTEWATSLLLLTQRLQRTIRERVDVRTSKISPRRFKSRRFKRMADR
jgi:hypothetical protein